MTPKFSIILTFILASCGDFSRTDEKPSFPVNLKTLTIKLVDSLGEATFLLPSRYDTGFTWTHHSDCGKPCDKIKYRFQPKILPVFKESGFYYYSLKDSIEQFTLSHSGYLEFHDSMDSSSMFEYHKHKVEGIMNDPSTYRLKFDTVERIGDRFFSVAVIDLYDSTKLQLSKKLLASTTIKSNIIDINYELLTRQIDTVSTYFIDNSFKYLRSIQFSNGK